MDRYQRVEKPRPETPINENEIRITAQGRVRSYITYATSLLQEKDSNEVVLKAMGRAINKTVMIVELIKRRVHDLHQNTAIGSTDITDTWEPLEEGLLTLETTRHVSMITIVLSKKELDKSSVGYQPPLPAELVNPSNGFVYGPEGSDGASGWGRGGRGRGRGNGNFVGEYGYGRWDRGNGQGYNRGRGRGFRGRGGSYSSRASIHQESSAYNDEAPNYSQGRGRGRGRGHGRGRGQFNGSVDAYAGNVAS